MTTDQLDHLKRIDAHLNNLLDIATRRTPGGWEYDDRDDLDSDGGWLYASDRPLLSKGDAAHADMAFIASCAGNAEAGWRAARLAINVFLDIYAHSSHCRFYAVEALEDILAAFPLESLNS